jgi:phosphoglycerate dehydrogenase-like enzyme
MKQGSVLVNVGAGLVTSRALLAALDRGARRMLCSTSSRPSRCRRQPVLDPPQGDLTPHSSGMSAGNAPRNDAIFVENLRRFLAGEPLEHEATAQDVLAGLLVFPEARRPGG